MSGLLSLEFTTEPLERVTADLAVVACFEDELPLRGGVGKADWRLCGLISEQFAAGRLKGERGEALLVPSGGRLRAQRIMLLGLGRRDAYRMAQVTASTREAILRCLALRVSSLAMMPLGLVSQDFPRCAEATLRGLLDGYSAARSGLVLRLMLAEGDISLSNRAVAEALKGVDHPSFEFRQPNSLIREPSRSLNAHATSTRNPV